MDVAIEPHRGKAMATGMETDLGQYRIRVDGMTVGFIGYAAGSPLCLTRRFSPQEIKEIESQVASLTEQDSVSANMPPEIPESLLNKETETLEEDDFN